MHTSNEEISGGLTVGRLVAHVDKVLTSLVRRTEVDLSTLVYDTDLVEVLVQLLARLIDGDDGRLSRNVGGYAKRLDELEGGGRASEVEKRQRQQHWKQ